MPDWTRFTIVHCTDETHNLWKNSTKKFPCKACKKNTFDKLWQFLEHLSTCTAAISARKRKKKKQPKTSSYQVNVGSRVKTISRRSPFDAKLLSQKSKDRLFAADQMNIQIAPLCLTALFERDFCASNTDYLARHLRLNDDQNYASAGLLPYRVVKVSTSLTAIPVPLSSGCRLMVHDVDSKIYVPTIYWEIR